MVSDTLFFTDFLFILSSFLFSPFLLLSSLLSSTCGLGWGMVQAEIPTVQEVRDVTKVDRIGKISYVSLPSVAHYGGSALAGCGVPVGVAGCFPLWLSCCCCCWFSIEPQHCKLSNTQISHRPRALLHICHTFTPWH